MRLLSLFSGIGAFEKAMKNIGIPFELAGYCEIDKFASKAYSLIHGVPESMNFGDITKIDASVLENIDMITYGFPCQDISNAGKQKGFEDEEGNRTRSGLFFEALRIIEQTKPKIAVCENVKALTGKKFTKEFQKVLDSLDSAGYANYWKVLNAKDYGIPQNRERVFIVSIRKDIDKGFEFPKPMPLELRLKDVLEYEVDEKYYLSKEVQDRFQLTDETFTKNIIGTTKPECRTIGQKDLVYQKNSIIGSLVATDYKQPKQIAIEVDGTARIIQVAQMYPNSGNPQAGRVYDATGISPAMDTCSGGNRMPKIVEPICAASRGRYTEDGKTEQKLEVNTEGVTNAITTVQKDNYVIEPSIPIREATKQGYAEAVEGDSVNLQFPNSKTRRGRVGKQVFQTLQCNDGMGVVVSE